MAIACETYVIQVRPLTDAIPPSTSDAAELEAWSGRLGAELDRASSELNAAVSNARAASVLGAFGALTERLAGLGQQLQSETAPAATSISADENVGSPSAQSASHGDAAWRVDVEQSVANALRRLDAEAANSVVVAATELAQHALAATSKGEGRRLADLLGNDVSKANRSVTDRRERQRVIDDCLVRLDAWQHPLVGTTAEWVLAQLGTEVGLTTLVARTDEAIASALAEADREFVAHSLRESLESMGYIVEEGFETLVADGGVAHIRAASWSDHAVRVRVFGDRSRMAFNVVRRGAPTNRARDVEVEREWCRDVDAIEEELREQGVNLDLTTRTDPGEAEVQAVEGDEFPFAADASKARAALRDGLREMEQ